MIDSVLPFVLAKLILGYGIVAVPKTSLVRPLLLIISIACCLVATRSTVALRIPGGVARDCIIGFIFHSSNFLCVSRVTPPPSVKSPKQRFLYGLDQVFNAQRGTTYVPPFDAKRPQYVPSRGKLLLQRLCEFLVTGGLAYALEHYDPLLPSDYVSPPGFLRRISEASRRELAVRVYFTLIGSLIPYLALRAGHSLTSCVALACGDAPERWPPLFGSISDAYTVRRWYSLFWHRAMRKSFISHATFFTYDVLGLPRRSQVSRYVITFLTFMLLTLMHVLTCPGIELCVIPAQLAINMGAAGAIVFEDFIISLFSKTTRDLSKKEIFGEADANGHAQASGVAGESAAKGMRKRRSVAVQSELQSGGPQPIKGMRKPPGWPLRLLGFCWVATFWTWSISNLVYSLYRC